MSDREELEKLRRMAELEAKATTGDFAKLAANMDPMDLSIARSKNDAFGDYLRKQASAPKAGETKDQTFKRQYGSLPKPDVGITEGSLRSGLQGLTMGAGDEMRAAAAATLQPVFGEESGKDWGQRYDAYAARERGKLNEFRDEHPVIAAGAEIAGAIPTMMLPGMQGPQAATLMGRVGMGALTAAAQGGVYGFNAGEGGFENRAINAGKTAAISAPFGALTPAVGAGASAAWNRYLTSRAAGQAGMPTPAYNILTRAMNADGSLAGPGAQRLQAAGNQAMLADAGPTGMTLLDTAVQRSGPAATAARTALDQRVGQASQTITNALDNTLGAPAGLNATARNIAQSTAGVRDDAYTAAYNSAINYADDTGRRVEEVLQRVPAGTMRDAIREANDEMRSNGVRNMQIRATIADDGTVTFGEMPNVQQLDEIKKALQRNARAAIDQYGRPTGEGLRARRLAAQLREAIGEAAPAYNEATRLGGDKIAMDEALDLGRRLMQPGTTREVVRDTVDGMSQAERSMVGQGIRAHLDETLANVKAAMTDTNMDAREAVKALKDLSSRAVREKVSAALGDAPARQLFAELDRAGMAFELRANVATNSRTFARQATDEAIKNQVEDGAINALRSGQPVNAGKRATELLLGRTPAAKQRAADETYGSLVNSLTGPRGQDAVRLLQQLANDQARIPGQAQQFGLSAEELARRSLLSSPIYQTYQANK
jgi:hypothetical protein